MSNWIIPSTKGQEQVSNSKETRKTWWNQILHFFMVSNCFYLLSVALLLLGAYMVMHTPILSKDPLIKYIEVYAILELYEILLIILGLLVLRRLGVIRDGLLLVGIEVFLFLDPTFFNNAFYAFDLTTGLAVNLACLVFMAVKFYLMVRIGRLPYSPRLTLSLILTGLYVYLYPAILSLSYQGTDVEGFYYFLTWVPLGLALIIPRVDLAALKTTNGLNLNPRQRQALFRAIGVITSYIVISHLIEAAAGYRFTFWSCYLSPLLLALCVLILKLKPKWVHTVNGNQFFWLASFIVAGTSMFGADRSTFFILGNFHLTPFHYTLIAVAGFHFYLRRIYKHSAHIVTCLICGLLFVSGHDLPSAWTALFTPDTLPLLYLAVVFTVLAVLKKRWLYITPTGLVYLWAFGKLLFSLQHTLVPFLLLQAGGFWLIFVMWKTKFDQSNTLWKILLFLILAYAFVASIGTEAVFFVTLYWWIFVAWLLIQGVIRKMPYLTILGILATVVKFSCGGRHPILAFLYKLTGNVNSGLLFILLAFAALFLGYYLSSLKGKVK